MESQETVPHHERMEMTMVDVWRIIRRFRTFILVFVLTGTLLVGIYGMIMPRVYTSVGTVVPPDAEKGGGLSSILQNAAGGLSLGDVGQGNKSAQFVDKLKSRSVAEIAADSCHIERFHKFKGLSRQMRIEALEDTYNFESNSNGLIIVECSLRTPYFASKQDEREASELSAALVNAAVKALDIVNRQTSVSRARRSREYIERYLVINRHTLDSVQNALETFRRENKILALEDQTNAVVESAASIGTAIQKTQVEIAVAKGELSAGAPLVQELEHRLQTLQEQFSKIQNGGLNPDQFSIPLLKIPELTRRYLNLIRDQKILEQINTYLETQRAQEAIQEQKDLPAVEVLDAAVAPEFRASPKIMPMLITAAIVLTILAVTIVLFRQLWRSSREKIQVV